MQSRSSRCSAAVSVPNPPRKLTSRGGGGAAPRAFREAERIASTTLPCLRSSASICGIVACMLRRLGSPQ